MCRMGMLLLVTSLVVGAHSDFLDFLPIHDVMPDLEHSRELYQDMRTLLKEKAALAEEIEQLQELSDTLLRDNAALEGKSGERQTRNVTVSWKPQDCLDLLLGGVTTSGIYHIYPLGCGCSDPMAVYCDMDTDGGGWTLILNRQLQDPQLNFNRTWADYKTGFGSVSGEHWLGNENMRLLSNSRSYALRNEFVTTDGQKKFFAYETFRLESETSRYRLQLGSLLPDSTLRDCYTSARNRYFSTYDRDHDYSSSSNYASSGGGGFWYSYGYIKYPPTGIYKDYMNATCYYSTVYQLSQLQMKIRPTACEATEKKISSTGHGCNSKCNSA